jgi:threonine dehydrogenase-like Zn-dependent dehydrogenase
MLPAVEQALGLLKNGGRLVIFGVSPADQKLLISPYDIYRRDISVTGSFLNPFTFGTAVDLMAHERFNSAELTFGFQIKRYSDRL